MRRFGLHPRKREATQIFYYDPPTYGFISETNLYRPEPTLKTTLSPSCRTNATPSTFATGLPLSVMPAGFTLGTQTIAVVLAGTTTLSVRRLPLTFHAVEISPW